MASNATNKVKQKNVMKRDWRWGVSSYREIKEGHFETETLELGPEWLQGRITFLEEGAAFLIKNEACVFEEHSWGPCAWNDGELGRSWSQRWAGASCLRSCSGLTGGPPNYTPTHNLEVWPYLKNGVFTDVINSLEMILSWVTVGLKSNDKCPCKIKEEKIHRGDGDMKTHEDTGAQHLEAKERQGLAAATRSCKRGMQWILLQSLLEEPNLLTPWLRTYGL